MISWLIGGLIATVIFSVCSVLLTLLSHGDFTYVVAIAMLVAVYLLPDKLKEKWADGKLFKVNPEIMFVIIMVLLSNIDRTWQLYWDISYDDPYLVDGIGILLCGALTWYAATMFDLIRRIQRTDFFKRSWGYRILLYIKKKREERLLKKKRSEFKDFLALIHEMAEGNLEVEFPDNLGAYEDFRTDLIKIREGIKEAVSREVKSEHMKMELVSNVSHDLKTPLTAMITYIDLLKDESLEPAKREEYLNIVSVRADRLKHLIEDLFEVTKATTGNVKFEPVRMDILNFIRQVCFELEDKFEASGIEVVTEMPEGKSLIMADSQKTYRIYANLLGNAAKYSMRNSRLYIQAQETENDICIIIKNISANKITVSAKDLTERFVRGDSSRNTEGSGLGLAIAKSFTELQGGTLDVLTDGDLFKVVTTWKKAT